MLAIRFGFYPSPQVYSLLHFMFYNSWFSTPPASLVAPEIRPTFFSYSPILQVSLLTYTLHSSPITTLFLYSVLLPLHSLWTHQEGDASGTLLKLGGEIWECIFLNYHFSLQLRDSSESDQCITVIIVSGMVRHIPQTFSILHAKRPWFTRL